MARQNFEYTVIFSGKAQLKKPPITSIRSNQSSTERSLQASKRSVSNFTAKYLHYPTRQQKFNIENKRTLKNPVKLVIHTIQNMDTECVSITLTLDPVKTIYNKLNCICETLKQIFSKLLLYKQSDPGSVTKQEFRSAQQGVCQISFIKLGKGSTSKENETKILTRCLCRLSLKVFVLSLCYRPLILYIYIQRIEALDRKIEILQILEAILETEMKGIIL